MDDLVSVGDYPTEGEAEVVAALLEASGIEAIVKGDIEGVGPAGVTSVMVSPEDRQAALDLIQVETSGPPVGDSEAESAADGMGEGEQ